MPNDWLVEERCPQCGGPVSMHEADRILTCAYCKVRLYVLAGGALAKYCLPVKPAPIGTIVMVPYWRLRAHRYRLLPSGVVPGAADCTALAADVPGLASSLGVRAQAVPLRFATPAAEGRFLPATRPPDLVFQQLERLRRVEQGLASGPRASEEREAAPFEATITTASSLVYTPVRVSARSVFDAVLNRRVAGIDADRWNDAVPGADDRPAPVRFLATLCPECGWQLEGATGTLILLCVNCGRGWRAGKSQLVPADFDVLPADGWTPDAHLPFWRAEARAAATWADFVRLVNLPRVVQAAWEREPLGFWFPAFAAHPDQFLRAAQTLTCARPGRREAAATEQASTPAEQAPASLQPRKCRAVTLPEAALDEALFVLLASLGHARRGMREILAGIDLHVHERRLVYVPARFNGRELVNPELGLTVQRSLRSSSFSSQL
ncbi:MAG TPA: hypothetical protein PKK95_10970 [Vicinamibacterales bacterium]|nr:hypothetical protein [Vicinamibacterales bacterium]